MDLQSYKQLEEEFDEKVKALQKICPHKKISDEMDEWWAVGHSTGNTVTRCLNCNKLISRKKGEVLKGGDGKC